MKKPSSQAPNSQVVKPQKQFGQHWLRQKSVLNKIVKTGNLKKDDLVIEIGPGLGILTRELAQKSGRVIAIEKDRRLIPILRANLKAFSNVEIVQGDILKLISNIEYLVSDMANTKYKVIANLPYYAATPIIRKFLELKNKPKLLVLMIQKEVAQRICSRPPKMTLLTVAVQIYAKAQIIDYVSRDAFWPKPKIDSAIIKLEPNEPELKFDQALFFKIVKAGFSQPRKKLANNLAKKLYLTKNQIHNWFKKSGLDANKRAQDLGIEDWIKLLNVYHFIVL